MFAIRIATQETIVDLFQAEKDQMIQALRAHHVNTLVELRRIERAFAMIGSPDVTEPMTTACRLPRQALAENVADWLLRVLLR